MRLERFIFRMKPGVSIGVEIELAGIPWYSAVDSLNLNSAKAGKLRVVSKKTPESRLVTNRLKKGLLIRR